MSNIKPYFELNGKTYEFERTRYLIAKYEELVTEAKLSADEAEETAKNVLKFQRLSGEVETAAKDLDSAKKRFDENPVNAELREAYKVYKEIYADAFDAAIAFETKYKSMSKSLNTSVNIWEKLLILAIEEQYKLSPAESKALWESYVDIIGKEQATEWVFAFYRALFEKEEKTDPFLERARELERQKSVQKASLNKVINH